MTAGQSATFVVVAVGTGPLSYQWFKNGSLVPAATSASYSVLNATASDNNATIKVTVSNSLGATTSRSAGLWVNAATTGLPQLYTHPRSQTVVAGQMASFSYGANSTTPLTVQWFRDGVAIQGATMPTYSTPVLALPHDDGSEFAVRLTNSVGSVMSLSGKLTVLPNSDPRPVLTLQPISQTVPAGTFVTFRSEASPPASSQWYRNGGPVDGATGKSFSFFALDGDNGNRYRVVVSNNGGSTSSQEVVLTVTPSPEPAVDVYVSGYTDQAVVWKNQVPQLLPTVLPPGSTTPPSAKWQTQARDLVVVGPNVHVVGSVKLVGVASPQAEYLADDSHDVAPGFHSNVIYWLNGVGSLLTMYSNSATSFSGAEAFSVSVDGADVIVSGGVRLSSLASPAVWRNGALTSLGSSGIAYSAAPRNGQLSVALSRNGLYDYTSYNGLVWSMGATVNPPEAMTLTALRVFNGVTYVAGRTYDAAFAAANGGQRRWKGAAFWSQGPGGFTQPVVLDGKGTPRDVVVYQNDVYVVGQRDGKPTVWKNGDASLTLSGGDGRAFRIGFNGTHCYVVGDAAGVPVLWKDGVRVNLSTTNGRATGIALAPP